MSLKDLNLDVIKNIHLDSGKLILNFSINNNIEEILFELVYNDTYEFKDFIYCLIVNPSFSLDDFNISDYEVEIILKSFVDENYEFFNEFDYEDETFLEEFKVYVKNSFSNQEKYFNQLLDSKIDEINNFIDDMSPDLALINNLVLKNSIILDNITYPIVEVPFISSIIYQYTDSLLDFFTIINHINDANEATLNFVSKIQPILPFSFIDHVSLTQDTINALYYSLNQIDWTIINQSLSMLQYISNIPRLDIVYTKKQEFAINLYNIIEEIDDNGEIKSIFPLDFLLSLTEGSWWIIPRFSKEEYNYLSSIENLNANVINQIFVGKYFENPELLNLMIKEWDLSDIRKKIISQAYTSYIYGQYESCVILLILQIEGILKEKISMKKSFGKLRQYLENQLNNNQTMDSWDTFLNKANIQYIWMILKPLGDNVQFNANEGVLNRNNVAHIGIVEANQLIALRFFFIIDTLMYILKSLEN